jgi:serine/threonine-protein kinase
LALACSFGEIDGDPVITNVPAPSSDPAVTAPGDQEPAVVDTTPAGPTANPINSGIAPGAGAYDPDADPFTSDIGSRVQEILNVNCGSCHSNGVAFGDMGFILDANELIKAGKIIPGNKEDSQIFVRMQQQSMPPAFIRDQRPTFGQIDLVGEFIDSLEPLDSDGCQDSPAFLSSDDMIAAMARDVARLDAQDQPFTRYLTVSYNSNAGGCGRELERQRFALYKGINSVSTNTQVTQPVAIDDDQLIFRVDIRDYDWNREIDLTDNDPVTNGVDFVDGWEAIVAAAAPYAVEFAGDDADDLKADTGTTIPFMPVNAFIQATEVDDLYYTLIGGRQNLFVFELDVLKIDTALEIADDDLMRAGFENSGVSKQERVLNRFDNGISSGQSYWISFDFDGGNGNGEVNGVSNGFEINVANESIFADPLGFAFAGGEAIFSLPNGMQGYYVAAANGQRLAEAPIGVVIDPAQNNGLVRNGASCHSCHNAGLITFTDTVRDFVIENRIKFDNETYESVLAQYPDPKVFQAKMDLDSAMHVNAVERAGVPKDTPDPITRTFLDFELGNIKLNYAAGELGVTPAELEDNLDSLDPRLAPLGEKDGYVDRAIFTNAFADALCVMHSVSENSPLVCP